jgi:hypothetical protein
MPTGAAISLAKFRAATDSEIISCHAYYNTREPFLIQLAAQR